MQVIVYVLIVYVLIVYVLSSILCLVFHNQLILYKFESEHQYFCIGKYLGGGGGGGMGLLYPGPGYEAIICSTHCKQSN